MDECEICKKSLRQGGDCFLHRRNCLLFEEEPRGRRLRFDNWVLMKSNSETKTIKRGCYLECDCLNDIKVIDIKEIDLHNLMVLVTLEGWEKEITPLIENKSIEKNRRAFKVLKGGTMEEAKK